MIPVVVDGNSYDAEDCQALVAARAAGLWRRVDLEAALVAAGMGKTRSKLVVRILLERGALAPSIRGDGRVGLTPHGMDAANQASPPKPTVVETKPNPKRGTPGRQPTKMPDGCVNQGDAALILDVCKTQVNVLVREGRLKETRIGREPRVTCCYARADLLAIRPMLAEWSRERRGGRRALRIEVERQPNELTQPEAAKILGCNVGYPCELVADGRLRARRVGKFYLFDRAEVEALATTNLRKPRGQPKGLRHVYEKDEPLPDGRVAIRDLMKRWGLTHDQINACVNEGWLRGDRIGIVAEDVPLFEDPITGCLRVVRHHIWRCGRVIPRIDMDAYRRNAGVADVEDAADAL